VKNYTVKKVIIILFILISTFGYSASWEILIVEQDTFYLKKSLLTKYYFPPFQCMSSISDKKAVWEIKNNKLYLTKLVYDTLFYNKFGRDKFHVDTLKVPSFAKWINDTISIDYGKPVALLRMGRGIINYVNYFESEMQLIIENGEVVSICKYQNEKKENGISIFNENLMDTMVKVLNNNIRWDSLLFNCPERTWVEDIFMLEIYKNGKISIKLYDEEAIKNGDYSDDCKELFVRKKEINRILSSLKFNRIKKHNEIIDCELIFDIRYDFLTKKILNPYSIR